jgi:hypothetical protein
MSTDIRVKASNLFDALEGLVYVTTHDVGPHRREDCKVKFIDAVEHIYNATKKTTKSKKTASKRKP